MLALGYNEYGGHPGRRLGLLDNAAPSPARRPNFFSNPLSFVLSYIQPYTEWEKAGQERTKWFRTRGQGYHGPQSTKPQTLGYGLADSPVGLLAWIYEKLLDWTDDYPWDDDEVLTWVSSYYFSRAGPTATLRIYYEVLWGEDQYPLPAASPTIPMGISYFPKEIIVLPRVWTRLLGNVVAEAEHEKGGHFAAHEQPEALVGDLRAMFGRGGPAFGVVGGRNGYDV
ncbi:putative epoxide hydrolase [Mycena indigotica]|uniref:Putative epoxide hydrolase n=1 Tax=Mycena indigotica TaxID=2126181 RepID=A0A8H6S341_9AGAR|nr:putative epoxide hydrolase [Mycena indigotica]KAF7291360.1 putative epoxide hydrolase [Mycena indigotica]